MKPIWDRDINIGDLIDHLEMKDLSYKLHFILTLYGFQLWGSHPEFYRKHNQEAINKAWIHIQYMI